MVRQPRGIGNRDGGVVDGNQIAYPNGVSAPDLHEISSQLVRAADGSAIHLPAPHCTVKYSSDIGRGLDRLARQGGQNERR
jgi:hypothetical protein